MAPKKVIEVTREDIINEVKEKAVSFDASGYSGFLAVQVTLSDLKEPFYVEIKDGKLSVEPYEYVDKQANLIISSANFRKLISRKLNPVLAFTSGKIKIEGDIEKAKELTELFKEP